MRRWGDGQGKHLTEAERDQIHRRIVAGESFAKVSAAIGCSTKPRQRGHQLDDIAADQRFAAGQTNFCHAQRGAGHAHEAKQVRLLKNVVRLTGLVHRLRPAVQTIQGTAIRDRDAQR